RQEYWRDDLATSIMHFLDQHLVFPLIITRLCYRSIKILYFEDIPHALGETKNHYCCATETASGRSDPTVKMLEDLETPGQMQSARDSQMLFHYLADKHGFRQEYLDTLCVLSHFSRV
uniref:Eukaryotic translation initiation factor 3 subunit E N-terminal domain-containing protein n=1 Tax=Bos indicus x Bos taurus TaxID=30522 RepID=A0A4W2FFS5_BOBOX